MTFKSLTNFGNFAKGPYHPAMDRYHGGGYHHSDFAGYHHGSRGNNKGKGGNGAALSALTLLAFLFLINVMQQSMQDNNATPMTTMTTIVLRNDDQPVIVDAKEDKEMKNRVEAVKQEVVYGSSTKSKIQRLNSQYIN